MHVSDQYVMLFPFDQLKNLWFLDEYNLSLIALFVSTNFCKEQVNFCEFLRNLVFEILLAFLHSVKLFPWQMTIAFACMNYSAVEDAVEVKREFFSRKIMAYVRRCLPWENSSGIFSN